MSTTQEQVHTGLFDPTGKEATPQQAYALQQTAEMFLSLGLAYVEPDPENEHKVDVHLADSGYVVLSVYEDGHAETPDTLPEPDEA